MSILRFDPFRDPLRDFDRLTNQLLSGTRVPQLMPMDAWRSGNTYHVALDLPGVDPGSIEITSERNAVTVRAERGSVFGDEDDVIVAERPQGSFTRQFVLGEGLDTQQMSANYESGVLQLTIPVAQAAQPRRIEVSTRSGGQQRQIDLSAEQPSGGGGEGGQSGSGEG